MICLVLWGSEVLASPSTVARWRFLVASQQPRFRGLRSRYAGFQPNLRLTFSPPDMTFSRVTCWSRHGSSIRRPNTLGARRQDRLSTVLSTNAGIYMISTRQSIMQSGNTRQQYHRPQLIDKVCAMGVVASLAAWHVD